MKTNLNKIEVYQNLGFLGIIVLCYLNDLLELPSYVFSNHPFAFVYRQSTLEMLLFLAVWFLVSRSTRRIMQQVQYLERFMRVCAWCRKINFEGQWMPIEKFMKINFNTSSTHGICQECYKRQEEFIARAREINRQTAAANSQAGELVAANVSVVPNTNA